MQWIWATLAFYEIVFYFTLGQIMMSSSHTYIRNILHSLCNLHKAGFGKIRFMICCDNGEYSVRVGPKRVFAVHDGLFIAEDLRHRSLLISNADSVFDESTVLSSSFLSEGRLFLAQLRNVVLGDNHEDRSIDDGLRGSDPDYTKWLNTLTSFLDDFDFALPLRDGSEYFSLTPLPLRIEFIERLNSRPIAPTIRFESPPGGLLRVTLPPSNKDLAFAQSRESSAPNLLWNVRSGESRDQLVDRIYEDRQMGGSNA